MPSSGPPNRQTPYVLWPKQQEAMRLLGLMPPAPGEPAQPPVDELLYGGQSGGGKSFLLRALGVTLCCLWPGVQIPIFRRTSNELEETHVRALQNEIGPPVATYEVGRKQMRFWNGSTLELRYCEEDAEVYKYNSAEWAALLVDQAETFTEFQLRFLRHRVRQSVIKPFDTPWRAVTLFSANPGGKSHAYLRDQFVSRAGPTGLDADGRVITFDAPADEGGHRRAYLPARLDDNPALDKEDYRKRLMGLPPHLRRAYMEGDWTITAGAYFDQFRATDMDGGPWHVWPRALIEKTYPETRKRFPPADWPVWLGIDGGVRDPWCVLWLTRAPDRRVIVYREWYEARVQVQDQATRLREFIAPARKDGDGREYRTVHPEHPERPRYALMDPAMFNVRANLAVSDAEVYSREKVPLNLWRGVNRRQVGWRRIGDALSYTLGDNLPSLVFLAGACPKLVSTLPDLTVDARDHEDISDYHGRLDPEKTRDDPADALRYALTPAATQEFRTDVYAIESRWEPLGGWRATGREKEDL